MGHISFDYSKALDFFSQEEIDNLQSTVTALDKDLREGLGAGNDFVLKKLLKRFKKNLKC